MVFKRLWNWLNGPTKPSIFDDDYFDRKVTVNLPENDLVKEYEKLTKETEGPVLMFHEPEEELVPIRTKPSRIKKINKGLTKKVTTKNGK